MSEHSLRPNDAIDDDELQSLLADRLLGWQLSGDVLERTFTFADFKAALKFVNQVAQWAEGMQHHPDIDIRYNRVVMALTSHDIGGISRRDLTLAGHIDDLARQCDRLERSA